MQSLPLVSVIIIFHDEERFLAEAVDSVIAQTWPHWELLLCDDGSTDGSAAIARDYALRYPGRVRYLSHPGNANRGMSATRNLGLSVATGELISFLDGDDVWVQEKLTRQVTLLQQYPAAAAVYGRLHVWHAWTREPADLARDYIQPLGVQPDRVIQPPDLLIRFLEDDVHTPSGLLFRRSVLDAVGGYEEAFRGMHEDGIVLAKICLEWPVYASSEVWYKYRQHPDSCCTREIAAGRDLAALRKYLARFQQYLEGRGYGGTEVSRLMTELIEKAESPDDARAGMLMRRTLRAGLRRGREVAERITPAGVRRWVGLLTHGARHAPPGGWVHMGNLRRTSPISQHFGFDRGLPVDRYYIESFLRGHAGDIRGRVLEIADATYTRQFGGDQVGQSDVLHARPGNPEATLIGDLTTGDGVPQDAFDCIILTQVLPFVWDVPAALATTRRALRPGGVLLVTVPGISQVSRYDADLWGDYWRFTSQSVRRLIEEAFPGQDITLSAYGNTLAATAFLQGMATHELSTRELEERHPDYEVIIAVRVQRGMDDGDPGAP
jgi:glycosyltransferase involved in cell wall biosynthesis